MDLLNSDPKYHVHKILYFIFYFIISYFVKRRYKDKYLVFREKWENENRYEKLLGYIYIYVVLFCSSSILLYILINQVLKIAL